MREGAGVTPEKERIYRELFEQNTNLVYSYIFRRVGIESDTEDITQDVFVALLFHLDEFIPGYPDNANQIRSWLFGVAYKKLLHYWRRNQKILDMEISTELLPDLKDNRSAPDENGLSLPDWLCPRDKKLLSMKYCGYSLKEIAPHLGLSYGACRMRSVRLADELKKYFQT